MTKQPLLILFIFLCFIACRPSATSEKVDTTVDIPSTPAPVANSTISTEINKATIDDATAERIKNFMTSSFLTGHLPVMTDADKKFQIHKIDMNGDGLNEYFVRFNSSYFCGSGGCTFLLLNNDITLHSKFTVLDPPIYVSSTKTKGWRNILAKSDGVFRELVYNDKSYPANPSTEPASNRTPEANDEVLFDDQQAASKIYSLSNRQTPQSAKAPVQRVQVFQKTYNAGTFSFLVNATNGETTPIHISSKGLPRAFDETIEIDGAVKAGHLLDLNNDGFKELYLITQLTGDSGNLDIMGIASYRDKSAGEIYVKDTKEQRKVNSDKVYVADGQLIREFIQEDKPMKFTYKLSQGETGFILDAVRAGK